MFEDFRLKVFITVTRCGSFTAAARELGITQPAVSQNIAELERIAGAPLFTRGRGRVSLTPKGRLFQGYAEQILHWYKAAGEALSNPEESDSARMVQVELGEGRKAELWGSQGDLHIKIL